MKKRAMAVFLALCFSIAAAGVNGAENYYAKRLGDLKSVQILTFVDIPPEVCTKSDSDKLVEYLDGLLYSILRDKMPPQVAIAKYRERKSPVDDAILFFQVDFRTFPASFVSDVLTANGNVWYYGYCRLSLERKATLDANKYGMEANVYDNIAKMLGMNAVLRENVKSYAEVLAQKFIDTYYAARTPSLP